MIPSSQPFLARDGTLVHLKVVYHSATRQYVIPWTYIADAFPHGYLVKNGDTILPFLSNQDATQDLLIEPLCVAYQENAVLEVVYEHSIGDILDSSFWPTRQFRRATHLVTEQRLSMAVSIANALSGYQPAVNILSHTFLYQDDSKPRLFIVLPTNTGDLLDQFRLYYLCEQGGHSPRITTNTGMTAVKGTISHDAHLVEHGGYKIVNPVAFFEKYGEYVLAILGMVKYGACAAGRVIPRLLQFGGMEGLEADDFRDKVDDMIHYLQQQQQQRRRRHLFLDPTQSPMFKLTATTKTDADADTSTNPAYRTLTKKWLGEEKFEDLDSFLENHFYNNDVDSDSNTSPANLHRVTTTMDGHVRWLCSSHFIEYCPQTTMNAHNISIQSHQGTFNIHTGVVKVRVATTAQAKSFYLLLANVPFFQELHLSLDWAATATDLKGIISAIQQSFLHKVELFVSCEYPMSSNDQSMVNLGRAQSMHLYLASTSFQKVQLKNRGGLPVQVRKWPNTVNTNTISLSTCILAQRDFSVLSFLLRSAPHLISITLQVDDLNVNPVLGIVETHIEQYKKIEKLTLCWKRDSHIMMSFKSGSTIPTNTVATLSNLDLLTSRITLNSITDLTLNAKNTPSEVDIIVQVLLACCTSLKNLCLKFDDPRENSPFGPLSIFKLGLIPTLVSIRLHNGLSHYESSFTFPLTRLDLRYMNVPLDDLPAVNKIITTYPSLTTLSMMVDDLDAAYGDIEPLIRHHQRDMTVKLEHKLGSHATIRFKRAATPGDTSTVSTIELRTIPIKKFWRLPLGQVQTLAIPSRSYIYQHDEIIEITQRCIFLETLEINVEDSLSLAAFCISTLPAIQSLHIITSRSDDISTYHTFPITKLNMAGRCLVTVVGGVSAIETFFKSCPTLSDLSLTVTDIARDLPAFISTIKSLSGHQLSKFVLKDLEGSVASISFDNGINSNNIASYSLHLKKLARQEDLQRFDVFSATNLVISCSCPVYVQPDKLFRELATECPRLVSIDIQCGSNFLPTFLQFSKLVSLKTCVFRNKSGQVAPNLDLVDGYLNIGNELLPKSLYPDLLHVLQTRPTITRLKILVESTFEAYEFMTSLAAKIPRLEEVRIAQQIVGPKIVVTFSDDVAAGSGRVWTVALDVRSLSQLQPKMLTLLTKLTVSGQVLKWTSQDLAMIPLASCENLSTLELKCPPSQFPRILRSMHEASLMHTSLRHLKLWDGSRGNILTGLQIDDLDAIAIHIEQVRMLDFQESLQELEALLQDYPLEISHLELDQSFNQSQAETIERSLKLGKVRIRDIQWDISHTKNARLFETMLRSVSHCYTNAASTKIIPTVTLKVCKNAVSHRALTMYQPGPDDQNRRVLSTLGQFMMQFVTHLILVNSGLEVFLPDLLLTELEALQGLEIRVNRYCPDARFLQWLQSIFQWRISQAPASSQQSNGLVEGRGSVQEEDCHDSDFVFDDPMSSSMIFGDDSSPPQLKPITTPWFAHALRPPTTAPLIHQTLFTTTPTSFTRQPFRRLILHNVQFTPPQWTQLLESMDFVSLRLLSLERVGFGDQEVMLLTTLYIDQLTRARKERQERKDKEIRVVGDDGDDEVEEEEKKEQEEEECVVRFYMTSVTHWEITREHTRLEANNCSQLKFVLV